MAIKYNVITSKCPHYAKVLKRQSDFSIWWFLLVIGTCFIALFWIIAKAIINAVFKYEYVKMGSPYINCPNCGMKVNMGESSEWGKLNKDKKKNWAFRNKMRACYVLGGLSLFSIIIPLFGFWTSSHSSDRTIAIVLLVVAIVSLFIVGFLYYERKKSLEEEFITVNVNDYDLIKESWRRLKETNPEIKEIETIYVPGIEKVIYPQKEEKKIVEKETKIVLKEQSQIKENPKVEYEVKTTETKKKIQENNKTTKPQKKHIIVANKKRDNN